MINIISTYPHISVLIVVAFISYVIGYLSHLFLHDRNIVLETRVALLVLVAWLCFAMISYFQGKELSLFFNAAGIASLGNILGIKTSEIFGFRTKTP